MSQLITKVLYLVDVNIPRCAYRLIVLMSLLGYVSVRPIVNYTNLREEKMLRMYQVQTLAWIS